MNNMQDFFKNLMKFNEESFQRFSDFVKTQKELLNQDKFGSIFEVKNKEDYNALFSEYQKMFQKFNVADFQKNLNEGFHANLYFDTLKQTAEQLKADALNKYESGLKQINQMTDDYVLKVQDTFDKAKKMQDDFIEKTKSKMK